MLFSRRTPAAPPEKATGPRVLARGQKTVVREFARADVDRWIAWPRHSDPLFDNYNAPALTERQRDLYFQQHRDAGTSRQYSVDDLDGHYIGRISIRDIDWRVGASVLGISFNPGRLNQGLGSDALLTFLGFYFSELRMSALFLDVAAFNYRAFRVYEKCGFRRCGERWGEPQTDLAGIFRKPEFQDVRSLFRWEFGLVRPLLIDMVIRRDEWERQRREQSSRHGRQSAAQSAE